MKGAEHQRLLLLCIQRGAGQLEEPNAKVLSEIFMGTSLPTRGEQEQIKGLG